MVPFLDILNGEGILTQIETSGSVFPWSAPHRHIFLNSVIVCSPKTPKVHSFFVSQADYWKYIIKAGETDEEGLPCWSTQLENTAGKIYRPYPLRKDKIYVQACDEGDVMKNAANLAEATRIALQFGYNLSIQTHKIVGVP